MSAHATQTAETALFAASRDRFETIMGWLTGAQAAGLEHADLETQLECEGRQLLRQLLADHLELRACREQRMTGVVDADGVERTTVETAHRRTLTSVFGDVTVERVAYRRRGHANLHPADAALNLPAEKHSHGLRRLAAIEASRGSFDTAVEAIARACGQQLGNARSKRSPPGPSSTSPRSTPAGSRHRATPTMCWSYPRTARAS